MPSCRPLVATLLTGASLLALNHAAHAEIAATALPTGGTVMDGSASISQMGATTTVNQASQRAIIDWQTFNVGSGAAVNFVQPNSASVALNRVLSAAPSTVDGKITANGQVYLINPAGIVFGAGAAVNVGGLVASTMDISNDDFMAGKAVFNRNGSTGAIVNQGSLQANPGGMIALLAPELRNEGVISAQLGTVVLAAGERVTMTMNAAGGDVTVQVDPATIRTMIDNRSIIVAKDGAVILSAKAADALIGSTINNSGTIEASSMTSHGGTIELSGATDIVSSGKLKAKGITGGTVTIAADQAAGTATITGKISVAGKNGKGGKATVTGHHILITGAAVIHATGTLGGGVINIGSSWENQDPSIPESVGVTIAPTAVLNASAMIEGDGGTIVVRSDINNPNSVTYAEGTFLALGGPQGGNGGRIETSGYFLDISGARGGASAPRGSAGLWLLDPYNVTIVSGTTNSNGSFSTGNWTPSATGSQVGAGNITTLLNGGTNVTISTGSSGTELGNITVSGEIDKTSGGAAALTLSAQNNIIVNAAILNTSSGALTVNLYADTNADGAGIIYLNGDITTAGGALNFGANTTASINGVSTLVGGDVYVTGTGLRSLSTGGGNVNVYGQMLLADASGLSITTAGGNVQFAGLVDSGNTYALVNSPSGSWTAALAAAKSGTGANVGDTYLATATSRLESQIIATTSLVSGSYQAVWLGAKRVTGIGTDAVWRWVSGPEGLQDSGNGQAFFTQNGSSSANGSGGSAIGGAYTNWNSGEPNNYGGTNLTAGGSTEYVMQTLGASGLWNDLGPSSTSVNYYVVETNLANSPLTVNAGTGTVTFAGAVGSNKQLDSVNVTGSNIAINGGSVTSAGAQTYTGPVTLGTAATVLTVSSGNFTGVSSESIANASGGNATLTINASGDVEIATGQSISSGTGSLGVSLVSSGGSVKLDANSSINTNGGALLLKANALSVNSTAVTQGGGSGSLQIEPYTQGTSLGIGDGAAGTMNIGNAYFTSNFINNTFGTVILGGSTTGLVTVGNTLNFSNNTTIESNADIALAANAALTASGKQIGLQVDNGGTVTENSASSISASGLLLSGTGGTFTLNNGNNAATNFAANTGSINYINNGALTVGTLSGVNGVTASGDVTIQTVGTTADITLGKSVTSTGGNITLASGRNFVNNTASGTGLVASGTGKQYFVYSADPSSSTEGMTGYSKHYNQSYTAGSAPSYASSGNWFLYSIAPVLTVNAANTTIIYGNADPSLSSAHADLSYSGLIDGDTSGTIGLSGSSGSVTLASYTASGAGFRPAGSYAETPASLGTLANTLGYSFSLGTTGTLTVSPRTMTATGFTAADKFFDSNTTATVTGINGLSLLSGDRYAAVGGVAAFDTNMIGNGKTVTESSLFLSGLDSGNYSIVGTGLTTTASIKSAPPYIPATNPLPESSAVSPLTPPGSPGAAGTAGSAGSSSGAQVSPLVNGNILSVKMNQDMGLKVGRGVVLTEIHDGNGGRSGILATVGDTRQGFSFTIPRDAFGIRDEQPLMAYETLPAWLTYNPKTRTFSADDVPPGGLPVVVALKARNGSTVELTIAR